MRVHLFRLTDWQEAKSPKKVKKTFLQNRFPGKFGLSEGQIDIMLAKKERHFSMKWTNADYCFAMNLRCLGIKALRYVIKYLLPVPAYSTLVKKFMFMHLIPGFLLPILAYMARIMPLLSRRQRACCLLFDESKITNRGHIDRKLDMIIGANKDNVSKIIALFRLVKVENVFKR